VEIWVDHALTIFREMDTRRFRINSNKIHKLTWIFNEPESNETAETASGIRTKMVQGGVVLVL
jgi:hypothetical protein